MERTFVVTNTKVIKVTVDDAAVSLEAIKEFSESIYKVECPDDLMRHAAEQVAAHGAIFVEGIGKARESWREDGTNIVIRFDVEDETVECELAASVQGQAS